ncbi:hypothetical protein B0T10DRAFT_595613 [Thelonectria olida]|uniref:Uncharacterized protein n=1 Tax=Thelonectria olida TaxID=1576542 RepID=A0A9P8W718_9HYPO|nr:hypothetical protein B0T10DRAFT_595613 [Thelonectria olida]
MCLESWERCGRDLGGLVWKTKTGSRDTPSGMCERSREAGGLGRRVWALLLGLVRTGADRGWERDGGGHPWVPGLAASSLGQEQAAGLQKREWTDQTRKQQWGALGHGTWDTGHGTGKPALVCVRFSTRALKVHPFHRRWHGVETSPSQRHLHSPACAASAPASTLSHHCTPPPRNHYLKFLCPVELVPFCNGGTTASCANLHQVMSVMFTKLSQDTAYINPTSLPPRDGNEGDETANRQTAEPEAETCQRPHPRAMEDRARESQGKRRAFLALCGPQRFSLRASPPKPPVQPPLGGPDTSLALQHPGGPSWHSTGRISAPVPRGPPVRCDSLLRKAHLGCWPAVEPAPRVQGPPPRGSFRGLPGIGSQSCLWQPRTVPRRLAPAQA